MKKVRSQKRLFDIRTLEFGLIKPEIISLMGFDIYFNSACGGIGRRAGLRYQSRTGWGFESPQADNFIKFVPRLT